MKSLLKIFLIPIIIINLLVASGTCFKSYADEERSISFTSTIDSNHQAPGGKIKLKIYSQSNFDDNISAFRLYLSFDNSRLSYKGIKVSDAMDDGRFKLREENGSIVAIFLEDKQGLKAEKDKITSLFEVDFSISEDVMYDSTNIEAYVDSALDSNCNDINIYNSLNQNITISSPLPADTSLKSLSPNSGTLTPDFDSNITNYSIDVDSSIDSITFDAIPVDPAAIVKINKKSLGKQGSTTEISITVTSPDKNSSTVYSVNVNRLLKETTVSATESSKSASASTSSKKTSSSNSNTASSNSKTANSSSSKSASSSASSSKKSASASSSSTKPSSNQQIKSVKSSSSESNKNPYTEIGHNLVMKKNSFDVFLMFILMCVCIFAAIFLFKRNDLNKK